VHPSVSLCLMTGGVHLSARCILACSWCGHFMWRHAALCLCVFRLMDCLSDGSVAPLSLTDEDIKLPVTWTWLCFTIPPGKRFNPFRLQDDCQMTECIT